jgi:uncharacterized damage-inducible protein DinB
MNLISVCRDILAQLAALTDVIGESDFRKPSIALSGSTVGQHMRHTLEFFLCLESGLQTGCINYDKRNHDQAIETDRVAAGLTIRRISHFLEHLNLDLPLKLEVNYHTDREENMVLETTSARELVYNIEHAVHHMALIKIGVREVAPYVTLDKHFGIAASTIRYRENESFTSAERR